jgi:small subunit ribosomal protein S9
MADNDAKEKEVTEEVKTTEEVKVTEEVTVETTEETTEEVIVETEVEVKEVEVKEEKQPEPVYKSEEDKKQPGRVIPGYGTGKRKNAIARVRLVPAKKSGKGVITVNGKEFEEYFPNKVHQQLIVLPLEYVNNKGDFDIFINVVGGGKSGQAGAVKHGVSKALNEIDRDSNRAVLKKAGFLTRDSRIVERKKAGLHKARKAPQFSKR